MREFLQTPEPEGAQSIQAKAASYSRQGVRGVPYFFFNGEPGFSGAQPPEVFAQIFDQVSSD